jgi:ureidoacrylate peracid hydrolase
MHKFAMPEWALEKVAKRRGGGRALPSISPSRTALIVIDMQNGFLMKGVAHTMIPDGAAIVPNVNRIATSLRDGGGTIVWIKNTVSPETMAAWPSYSRLAAPERQQIRAESMRRGSIGHALWADLDVRAADLVLEKIRFSAFIAGSSDIEPHLRDRGVDTVIVTGAATNVCCESTARDAMMRNFNTIMVSDANVAASDEEHSIGLVGFYLSFGDVMTTNELLQHLAAGEHAEQRRAL